MSGRTEPEILFFGPDEVSCRGQGNACYSYLT
jgi:hypothetical protein